MTSLRIQDDIEIGVATHVGRVRMVNEDDYLVVVPADSRAAAERGRIFAVADGMGGVAGGAEASRAAIRAVGAALSADDVDANPPERLRAAFDAASDRVHELAAESSDLADMGTTLTTLLLLGSGRAFIGHVGDTRCLRLRRGTIQQLTEDHAMREPRNLLTRAIGAGQRHEDTDVVEVEVRVGDVFLLCTDGVWGQIEAEEMAGELRSGDLQTACERIVSTVWERGAPDNATVLAVRVAASSVGSTLLDLELPDGETRIGLGPIAGQLEGPHGARWPLWLFAISLLLGALAWLRFVHGVDVLAWLRG